jgi:hypothetical protein
LICPPARYLKGGVGSLGNVKNAGRRDVHRVLSGALSGENAEVGAVIIVHLLPGSPTQLFAKSAVLLKGIGHSRGVVVDETVALLKIGADIAYRDTLANGSRSDQS